MRISKRIGKLGICTRTPPWGYQSVALVLTAFGVITWPAVAVPPVLNESQKVAPSDLQTDDYFGWSTAISGADAVVGAYANGTNYHGSATFYHFNGATWAQSARFMTPGAYAFDGFAGGVAIDGNTAVVGARYDPTGGDSAGIVHVYQLSGGTWSHVTSFNPPAPSVSLSFGADVAISGNRVIVGAPGASTNFGAAYIYERNGASWTQTGVLTPGDGGRGSGYFGRSVSISGDWAFVGAAQDHAAHDGQAYAFHWDGQSWTQTQSFQTAGVLGADLGSDVAVSGDYAVLGAQSPGGTGRAFALHRNGAIWELTTLLLPTNVGSPEFFGRSVAIDGSQIVVGAYDTSFNNVFYGAAYTYQLAPGGWLPMADLAASDRQSGDAFGLSTAISGNRVLVGAIGDDDQGSNAGAGYFFNLPEPRGSMAVIAIAVAHLFRRASGPRTQQPAG